MGNTIFCNNYVALNCFAFYPDVFQGMQKYLLSQIWLTFLCRYVIVIPIFDIDVQSLQHFYPQRDIRSTPFRKTILRQNGIRL